MSTEIEACFLSFFSNINDIEERYKDSNNINKNNELGEVRNIYFKFFELIKKELEKDQITRNDACHFSNNVCNGFVMNQSEKSMNNYLKNNLSILNGFTKESKEIISLLSDLILADNFKFKDSFFKNLDGSYNSDRIEMYLYKLQNEIYRKWKFNQFNSDYFDDINELNKILQRCSKNYNNSDLLVVSNSMIYGMDNLIKIELIKFFESLEVKYNKLEKLKKKIAKTKTDEKPVKEIKIKEVKEKKEETDDKPKKKTKEKIPATVKNSLWRTYFKENIVGICQCCKKEQISVKNFDCGHIISEKNGGSVSIDNLKPICRLCNSSMGTMNMQEFINKYGLNKKISI